VGVEEKVYSRGQAMKLLLNKQNLWYNQKPQEAVKLPRFFSLLNEHQSSNAVSAFYINPINFIEKEQLNEK